MAKTPDDILGKRLVAMELKWSHNHVASPRSGLFLIFDDGTYYELYTGGGYIEPGSFIPANKQESADVRYAGYTLTQSARWTPKQQISPAAAAAAALKQGT